MEAAAESATLRGDHRPPRKISCIAGAAERRLAGDNLPAKSEGADVIVTRTENPQWLSNAYLVADEASGKGVLIDGNDDLEPLLKRAEQDGVEITHILVTHTHLDHIAGLAEARERLGRPPLVAHEEAAAEIDLEVKQTIAGGEKLSTGGLEIEAISTPGHAAGHLAFLINGSDVFTADVLFKGTVGGTMAPGASGFADLKASVMRLMELPPQTEVHPGHREATTIGAEWEDNPFVRVWRGLDETGEEECSVWGRPSTLKLWAPDYDGGHKAWVLFGDSEEDAIVGGSQVERS
jgi:glyoxylase-like metal-dependent hydrolase (beta-lactamase superfamily II)